MKFSSSVATTFICSAALSSALVIPRTEQQHHTTPALASIDASHEQQPPITKSHSAAKSVAKGLKLAATFANNAQGYGGTASDFRRRTLSATNVIKPHHKEIAKQGVTKVTGFAKQVSVAGGGSTQVASDAGSVYNLIHNLKSSSGSGSGSAPVPTEERRDLELLVLREYYEDLLQRGYDEDLDIFERGLEEEMDARAFDEEIDARDFDDYEFEARDLEAELDARDFGDELMERGFEGYELDARDFAEEELGARDFEDQLMERSFEEYELDARDFRDFELEARDLEIDELD